MTIYAVGQKRITRLGDDQKKSALRAKISMLWGTLDGPGDRDRHEKYARLPSYRVRRSGEDDYTTIISIRLIVFRYSTSGPK
jgi:hypothetical protein